MAAGATYGFVHAVLPGHTSWAVISSIYVVSQSSGHTLQAATGRALGTLFGTLIGFASVVLLEGNDQTGWRIALAAFCGSAITTFKPGWRFGIVAAVAVALNQDSGPALPNAFDRALGILAGAAIGVFASFLVWRESAERRTRRAVSEALEACEDLVRHDFAALAEEEDKVSNAQRDVLGCLRRAREEVEAASGEGRERLDDEIAAVQRLWHALIIVDRAAADDWPLQGAAGPALKEALERVKETASERLTAMREERQADARDLDEAVEAAIDCSDPTSIENGDREQAIALGGLAFALREIARNIGELEELAAQAR